MFAFKLGNLTFNKKEAIMIASIYHDTCLMCKLMRGFNNESCKRCVIYYNHNKIKKEKNNEYSNME